MYEQVADRIRRKFLAGEYVIPLHAEEEMDDDGLTLADVEHTILSGRIAERQVDATTRELKYLVYGRTSANRPIAVVAKLSPTGKVAIITAYAL